MLELFIIDENGFVAPNPELLTISIFAEMNERDKTRKVYLKELAYIFWEANYQSPFRSFDVAEVRLFAIIKDVRLPEDWRPDDLVLEGIEKYKFLQSTASMPFLEAAEIGLNQLKNYIKDTKLDAKVESGSKKGELLNDAKKYGDMFESMPKKVKAYQEMKNLVDAEILQKKTGRGGRELGRYAN